MKHNCILVRKALIGSMASAFILCGASAAPGQILTPPPEFQPNAPTLWWTTAHGRAVRMEWRDNSAIESGYYVEYRRVGTTTWVLGRTLPANATSAIITVNAYGAFDIRVRAFRRLSSGLTQISPDSNILRTYSLAPPSELQADCVSRIAYGRFNAWWVDNSSDELGFEILYRHSGDCDWRHLAYAPANATSGSFSAPTGEPWGDLEITIRCHANGDYTDKSYEGNAICLCLWVEP